MNKRETLKIMAVMRAAYPGYYRDITPADAEAAANLWQTMLADRPYELVAKAVKMLIATAKFPPTIAEVNEAIGELTSPPVMTGQEAWHLVYKAVCNSAYESRKEFEKLPEDIRRVVGSPNILREWALMDAGEVQTVVASNFQRAYTARAAKDRKYAAIPADVRAMLEQSGLKSIPGEPQKILPGGESAVKGAAG